MRHSLQFQISPDLCLQVQPHGKAGTQCTSLPLSKSAISPEVSLEAPRSFRYVLSTQTSRRLHPHRRRLPGSNAAFICLPLLADKTCETATAMLVETSRPQMDLPSVWHRYCMQAFVPGALLLSIDTAAVPIEHMEIITNNMLILSVLIAPMLLLRALPWLTATALSVGCTTAKSEQSSEERMHYVLGHGLHSGHTPSSSFGDTLSDGASAADLSVSETDSDDDDDVHAAADFLFSVMHMSPQELASLPHDTMQTALAAFSAINAQLSAAQRGVLQDGHRQSAQQQQPSQLQQRRVSSVSCRDPGAKPLVDGNDDDEDQSLPSTSEGSARGGQEQHDEEMHSEDGRGRSVTGSEPSPVDGTGQGMPRADKHPLKASNGTIAYHPQSLMFLNPEIERRFVQQRLAWHVQVRG